MHDIFTAILLVNHLSRRHVPEKAVQDCQPESGSAWARVFAWHRRGTSARA
jgi:hypothetical protein